MAQTQTWITKENITKFPIGQRVRFWYGAMHGSEDGLVVEYGSNRWGYFLIAETENGEPHTIHAFTTVGIGVYLIS